MINGKQCGHATAWSSQYKKGDKKDPSNYRPVSLTSVVCKILEKIVRDHIIEHYKKNNLISNSQFGFLSGRSTVIQMLQVMQDWTNYIDQGKSVDVIYMDFMKAFDKVSHKHLIHKLKNVFLCLSADHHY